MHVGRVVFSVHPLESRVPTSGPRRGGRASLSSSAMGRSLASPASESARREPDDSRGRGRRTGRWGTPAPPKINTGGAGVPHLLGRARVVSGLPGALAILVGLLIGHRLGPG